MFWEKNKYRKDFLLPDITLNAAHASIPPTWKIAFVEVLIKTIHHTFMGQVGFKSARENDLLLLNP